MDETLNAVNDAQGQTVDAPQTEPIESEAVETVQEVAIPDVGAEKVVQTPEQNAWYAKQRKEAEEAKAEAERVKRQAERLKAALNQYGYEGEAEDIADALEAQKNSITVEELRARREAEARRIRDLAMNDPEIRKIKEERDAFYQMQLDQIRKGDLEKVKKAFPDVAAKDVKELGEQFAALRANGIDAVVAYAAIRQAQETAKPKVPPSIGGINEVTSREKDYYTPQEVDALSEKDLNNPKIWDVVRKSMTKWK